MPINPSIPLSAIGRPQPAPDLLGTAQSVFALKEQQARTQELLRQQERQRQYEALASQYGDDPERFIAEVSRIDPMQGQKFSEQLSKARKEQAAAYSQQLKAEREHFEIGLSLLQGATPENYAMRRQWITSTFPQLAQALPEQYDEAAVSSLLQTGLSTKDFLAAQADAAERMAKGETREAIATLFANAKNPQEWAAAQELTRKAGLSSMLGLFGEQWSAEGQAAAAQLSMTPAKKAELERQAAALAETQRHNRQMEAVARGHLAVAQGNLGLRKQEVALKQAESSGEVLKLPAGTAEKVAGIEQSLANLDRLEELVKNDWLGPVAGRAAQLSLEVPGMSVSEDLAEFAAVTATLKNAVIKAVTGAQMSEPEAKRILAQVPDLTNKPAVWRQRAKATRDNLKLLRRRMLQMSGVANPQPPPSGRQNTQSAGAPQVGERRRFGNKIGEWDGKGWKEVAQ